VVKPYDPDLPSQVLTDASRLFGLGYVLIQKKGSDFRLIQAGSRALSSAERNYATIELECLGLQWAVNQCQFYLQGCPEFEAVTDHKPLLGIFAKSYVDIENARLRRICEKLQPYNFKITWKAGKEHQIADALSRAPTQMPGAAAAVTPAEELEGTIKIISEDSNFKFIREATKGQKYQRLAKAIRNGDEDDQVLRSMKKIRDELSVHEKEGITYVLWGHRLVIPRGQGPSCSRYCTCPTPASCAPRRLRGTISTGHRWEATSRTW